MAYRQTEGQGTGCIDRVREGGNELIVFNDNEHTFEYVAECLMEICYLTQQQAVTCTNIIDYKGECIVKHGSFETLCPMSDALEEKGLKNEIR